MGPVVGEKVQERDSIKRLRTPYTCEGPLPTCEELERDNRTHSGLPEHSLGAPLSHGYLVVGDVIEVHLAGGAIEGAFHPGAGTRLSVHKVSELRRVW
jgi:hypothetical protein